MITEFTKDHVGRKLTDDEVAVLFEVFTNMGRIE